MMGWPILTDEGAVREPGGPHYFGPLGFSEERFEAGIYGGFD